MGSGWLWRISRIVGEGVVMFRGKFCSVLSFVFEGVNELIYLNLMFFKEN